MVELIIMKLTFMLFMHLKIDTVNTRHNFSMSKQIIGLLVDANKQSIETLFNQKTSNSGLR